MYFDDFYIVVAARHFFFKTVFQNFMPGTNSLEFIRSGHIKLEHVERGITLDLKAPAFYWMKKKNHYRYVKLNQESSKYQVEHIYLDFQGARSERILAALDELYPAGMFHPSNPEEVSESFFRILHLYRIGAREKAPEIGVEIEKLVCMAYRSLPSENNDTEDLHRLDKIVEMFQSDPFAEYDLHKTAADLNISYDHFRRIFRNRYKISPFSYLFNQRMTQIAELLGKTDIRIKELVYSCNYPSIMEFSRQFKKFSGFSPREYRKQIRQAMSSLPGDMDSTVPSWNIRNRLRLHRKESGK